MQDDKSRLLYVAKRLHAADRSGSWDACPHKSAWLRWARVAIQAADEASAMNCKLLQDVTG